MLFVVAVTLAGLGALLISGLVALLVTAAAGPIAGLVGGGYRIARRFFERSGGETGDRVIGARLELRAERPLPTHGVAELI